MKNLSVGLELRSLNNLIMRYFESLPHKKEIDDATCTNGRIISFLSEHANSDIFQKDIEEHFTVTRSTVSKGLHLMERKGLIQRRAVDYDARLKKIILTEKAWRISEIMKSDAMFMEQNLINGFTEEELRMLRLFLQRMKENILNIQSAAKPDRQGEKA